MDTNVNVFLEGTRRHIRFETEIGLLAIEDLWDLPLTRTRGCNLDSIAVSLSKQLRESSESFVTPSTNEEDILLLQFAIVKQIIDTKLAERDAAKASKEKAEKKQKILAILERKQDAVLENASAEELQTILATL